MTEIHPPKSQTFHSFALITMKIIFAAATAPPSLRPPPPDSSRWAWRRPCHVGQQFPGSRPPLCRKITRLAQSLLDNHLAENVAYHNLKWSPGRHKKNSTQFLLYLKNHVS